MQLICLNAWGGKLYQPLIDFIKENSEDTDIFCLQEVFSTTSGIKTGSDFRLNLYQEISYILKNHNGYFASCLDNYIAGDFHPKYVDFNLSWGLAIFITKKIPVKAHHELFVYRERNNFDPSDLNTLPRNIQYINFIKNNNSYTVCNIHGIWHSSGKGDNNSRISQSIQINEVLNKQKGGKILCGDFNLDINTQSIKLLEANMSNLIKKYNIKTTRTAYFPGSDEFADYVFVSPSINIDNFTLPDIKVSDHLPMILQFS